LLRLRHGGLLRGAVTGGAFSRTRRRNLDAGLWSAHVEVPTGWLDEASLLDRDAVVGPGGRGYWLWGQVE
jgi:hypothetical protein